MDKETVISTVDENPSTFYFKLKSSFPEFVSNVKSKFEGDTFSEKLWIWVYGDDERKCDLCSSKCQFKNFNSGYCQYCSQECMRKMQSEKAKEICTCKQCGNEFEILQSKSKKLCSIECRNNWLSREEVVEERVKKTKDTVGSDYGNHVNTNKAKQTKKERHGDENYNNIEKAKKTQREKYGGYGYAADLIKRKAKKKTKERYGKEQISKTQYYRDKRKQSDFKRLYNQIVNGDRLKSNIEPRFDFEDYNGTEYHQKYPFVCTDCNTEFEDHLYSGNVPQCPSCNPNGCRVSTGELEVRNFVNEHVENIIPNTRNLIDGEVDIYIPSQNLVIEYNGLYWHSNENVDKNYHLNKTRKCEDKGIQLVHIFSDEWNLKKDDVKGKLKKIISNEDNQFSKDELKLNRRWHKKRNIDEYELVDVIPPDFWYLDSNFIRRTEEESEYRIWNCGYLNYKKK